MRRILVAPNPFKGHYSALEICQCFELELADDFLVESVPLSDGGDGFIESIHTSVPELVEVETEVQGPVDGMRVSAKWLWDESNRIAYLESAEACGLRLLEGRSDDPMGATSYGVGELIRAAIEHGAEDLYLGLGGTACSDGGIGILQALGFKVLDEYGNQVPFGAHGLLKLQKIVPNNARFPHINLMMDVETSLLGDHGCAFTFAPQKGANAEQVADIERGLSNMWLHIYRDFRVNVDFPGAGAAGGIPAGMALIKSVAMGSGFELVADLADLDEKIEWADVVVTGEGVFDSQSMLGKTTGSILERAVRANKETGVIAWKIDTTFQHQPEYVESMSGQAGGLKEAVRRFATKLRGN